MKVSAILLAGGIGSRMGSQVPKQFLSLKNKPVVSYSYEILSSHPSIQELIVVCAQDFRSLFPKATQFSLPGTRRQDSVYNGFQRIQSDSDLVLIHDGARPFITCDLIQNTIDEAACTGAACAAVQVKNTIKMSKGENFVSQTLDRNQLWEIQTPQVLKRNLLEKGFSLIHKENIEVTDDVSLAELLGKEVKLVRSFYENIKITTPDDLKLAEYLLS